MPIILGALLVILMLLGVRILLNADPKILLIFFKGMLGAAAFTIIVLLLLSGRLMNVVIGLMALMPLFPIFKKLFSGEESSETSRTSLSALSTMTPEQARSILNISELATAKEIKAAHRRMIQKIHPDQGGSDYLAAQVNRAKEVLLNDEIT